jgi:PAS domain-containing protein
VAPKNATNFTNYTNFLEDARPPEAWRLCPSLILPQQYREAHRRGIEHFLKTGEGPVLNRRLELSALRRDGQEFPIELTISAIPLRTDFMFTAFIQDVTERKRIEEALRQNEALFRELYDEAPVGYPEPMTLS